MEERFYKRYESFKRSLDALAEARQRDMSDSFVLSGTTAKFSIAMNLAWKVMKDIIVGYYEITDFVTGSPKEVLKKAEKIARELDHPFRTRRSCSSSMSRRAAWILSCGMRFWICFMIFVIP